ncbi:MAG: heavy-metal-associated domain-containing protein [Chloroflexota bacterium]
MMNAHENCHVEPLEKPLDAAALSTAMAAYLAVWGMGCPRCAMRVRNGLLSLEAVLFVEVFLEKGLAIVAYQPERVTSDDLVGAVAAAGSDGRHHYRAGVVVEAPAAQVLWG